MHPLFILTISFYSMYPTSELVTTSSFFRVFTSKLVKYEIVVFLTDLKPVLRNFKGIFFSIFISQHDVDISKHFYFVTTVP